MPQQGVYEILIKFCQCKADHENDFFRNHRPQIIVQDTDSIEFGQNVSSPWKCRPLEPSFGHVSLMGTKHFKSRDRIDFIFGKFGA